MALGNFYGFGLPPTALLDPLTRHANTCPVGAPPSSPCSPTKVIRRCCSFSLGLLREMCQSPW